MRLIDDAERRARLARRHALSPAHRAESPLTATEAVVALHATDPATPFLSLNARIDDCSRDIMTSALVTSRTLVKQLAMRRTVFVFPREDLGAVLSGPAARVAAQQRARLIKDVQQAGLDDDPEAWLDTARSAVLDELAGGRSMSAADLHEGLGALSGRVSRYEDKTYGGVIHIAPLVLTWLGAAGHIVRAGNLGGWRTNRILWARMDEWLDGVPVPEPVPEASPLSSTVHNVPGKYTYRHLVARYLRSFGPATETDLVWWFGATKATIRSALTDLDAVRVRLEGDETGWVLPDDLGPEPKVEPWAALLPPLDPTALGWKQRNFYLERDLAPLIFDRTGNCRPTAWWDGRIVGSYVQDVEGRIEVVIVRDPGRAGRVALESEVRRLQTWLDGDRVNSAYKCPLVSTVRQRR